jgi:hypothetical protein
MFKKIIITFYILLFITSCFSNDKQENKSPTSTWVILENNLINLSTWSTTKISNTWTVDNINDTCIQVITYARSLQTWVCRTFPSPCSVPENYKKVDSCDNGKIEVWDNNKPLNWTIDKNIQHVWTWSIKKDNKNEKEIVDEFEKELDNFIETLN